MRELEVAHSNVFRGRVLHLIQGLDGALGRLNRHDQLVTAETILLFDVKLL